MAYELRFAPEALAELDEILTYINEKSPQGSLRVQGCVQAAVNALRQFPHTGQVVGMQPPPVRRVLATPYPYAVFYEIAADEIIIVGVRHTARDPASMPGD